MTESKKNIECVVKILYLQWWGNWNSVIALFFKYLSGLTLNNDYGKRYISYFRVVHCMYAHEQLTETLQKLLAQFCCTFILHLNFWTRGILYCDSLCRGNTIVGKWRINIYIHSAWLMLSLFNLTFINIISLINSWISFIIISVNWPSFDCFFWWPLWDLFLVSVPFNYDWSLQFCSDTGIFYCHLRRSRPLPCDILARSAKLIIVHSSHCRSKINWNFGSVFISHQFATLCEILVRFSSVTPEFKT